VIVVLLLVAAGWLASHEDHGADMRRFGGLFLHTLIDELRGAPDADDLLATARFDEAGIAFDYPAVLRRREEVNDGGSRTWSLEYGMFSLELYVPNYDGVAADHLGLLAEIFDGGRSIDAEGPTAGRRAVLCGEDIVATRIRLKLMGDWSQQEGFDLPSPDALPRILIFDDELVGGENSRLAQATYERVLGSLQCATAAMDSPDRD
jgi:hypothetical protein